MFKLGARNSRVSMFSVCQQGFFGFFLIPPNGEFDMINSWCVYVSANWLSLSDPVMTCLLVLGDTLDLHNELEKAPVDTKDAELLFPSEVIKYESPTTLKVTHPTHWINCFARWYSCFKDKHIPVITIQTSAGETFDSIIKLLIWLMGLLPFVILWLLVCALDHICFNTSILALTQGPVCTTLSPDPTESDTLQSLVNFLFSSTWRHCITVVQLLLLCVGRPGTEVYAGVKRCGCSISVYGPPDLN